MSEASNETTKKAEQDARYLVAGCTPWARRVFVQTLSKLPGQWRYLSTPDELEWNALANYFLPFLPAARPGPHRVFFLHWRWKVPAEIIRDCECIGFHLGYLPSERGGSPLQHRILAGRQGTVLTMFRMTEALDAGPIYSQRWIPLHGAAEAIYARAMDRAAGAITEFVRNPWPPVETHAEHGDPGHVYRRRTPEESQLSEAVPLGLEEVYDRIRMVDAAGYPLAFLEYAGLRFSFRRAVRYDGRIEADVTITEGVGNG